MEHRSNPSESSSKHQQGVNSSSVIIDSPNHNNNTQHLIAPTHSNNIRLTPKKLDMELASHRPVLHKYPAAQVEIVYHRKSGESEVLSAKKAKSKKKTTQKSSKLRSEDQSLLEQSGDNLDHHGHNHVDDVSFTEQDTTNNDSILSLNDSRNGSESSSSVLPTNNDLSTEQHQVIVETVKSASTMTLTDAPDDDEQMHPKCRELIDELWSVIESMKLEISDLHARVGTLESTVMNDIKILKVRRQKHLLSSKAIADDMQRMQNTLNNSNEWKRIEEEVDHLLKRAKRSHIGSSKMSGSPIVKPIEKEN